MKFVKNIMGVFMAMVMTFSFTVSPVAHAASITDSQLEEQRLEVLRAMVPVLEEYLKLTQMRVIVYLEGQVEVLEARLAASGK